MTNDELRNSVGIDLDELKKRADAADDAAKDVAKELYDRLGEDWSHLRARLTELVASKDARPVKIEDEAQLEGWAELLRMTADLADEIDVAHKLEKAPHYRPATAVDMWRRELVKDVDAIRLAAKRPMGDYAKVVQERERARLRAEAEALAAQEREAAEKRRQELEAAQAKLGPRPADGIERVGDAAVAEMRAVTAPPPAAPEVAPTPLKKATRIAGVAQRMKRVLYVRKRSHVPAATIAALITAEEIEAILRRALVDGVDLSALVRSGAVEIVEEMDVNVRRG